MTIVLDRACLCKTQNSLVLTLAMYALRGRKRPGLGSRIGYFAGSSFPSGMRQTMQETPRPEQGRDLNLLRRLPLFDQNMAVPVPSEREPLGRALLQRAPLQQSQQRAPLQRAPLYQQLRAALLRAPLLRLPQLWDQGSGTAPGAGTAPSQASIAKPKAPTKAALKSNDPSFAMRDDPLGGDSFENLFWSGLRR